MNSNPDDHRDAGYATSSVSVCVRGRGREHCVLYRQDNVTRAMLKTVHNDPSRSSKVVDFDTIRKRVWDFPLVRNSNLGPILPRLRDIRAFVRRKPLYSIPTPIPAKISGVPFGLDPWCWGSADIEHPRLTNREFFSSNSNVRDRDTSTSRTDRQTTCHSNTARALRGKKLWAG